MSSHDELEQTYEALKVILEDDETFNHVCTEVFKNIDGDGSGSLERAEIRNFINNICQEMGMKNNPMIKPSEKSSPSSMRMGATTFQRRS
jgi:hypothetical protein